ncbi:clusterin-associated protein 1 homolog isoform X2 [Varroa destructor]|uniref:Clusterin-associated protein 1 n=1 Tax=Varroa destructor TaxID=109461 RepID=A0A7M7KCY5_VARDE|nr:clusterin-associated protein 1 homolog isoform X2 [Varroa destructor]
MSYRETKNLIESLRALGYSRLLPMDSFKKPNFPLLAEILEFLMTRIEPELNLPPDLNNEHDRVYFVKMIAETMMLKANLKLSTKRLYGADAYAIREVLKLVQLLQGTLKEEPAGNGDQKNEGDEDENVYDSYAVSSKFSELRRARQLASDLTSEGASLFDLLGKEVELKKVRNDALSRYLEISQVERCIGQVMTTVRSDIEKTRALIANVHEDETNLEQKIEKRKQELERSQNRLQTLRAVRPAYMDEYEVLEDELKEVYQEYVRKYRCLAYLEQQLEELERLETQEKAEREERVKKMVGEMREMGVEGTNDGDEGMNGTGKLRTRRDVTRRQRVFGSMTAPDKDSDSDLELDEDEDGSDNSSDDVDLAAFGAVKAPNVKSVNVDSDNDF